MAPFNIDVRKKLSPGLSQPSPSGKRDWGSFFRKKPKQRAFEIKEDPLSQILAGTGKKPRKGKEPLRDVPAPISPPAPISVFRRGGPGGGGGGVEGLLTELFQSAPPSPERQRAILSFLAEHKEEPRDAIAGERGKRLGVDAVSLSNPRILDDLHTVIRPEGQGAVLTNPAIRRILIANRGEIAMEVLRKIEEENKTRPAENPIIPIVVYGEADRQSLYVRYAREKMGGIARLITADPDAASKPADPKDSPKKPFINISGKGGIIEAAMETQADAVHPCYGFLSESPLFSEACREAGLVFIGPPPEAAKPAERKDHFKVISKDLGFHVTPGTLRGTEDLKDFVIQLLNVDNDFPGVCLAEPVGIMRDELIRLIRESRSSQEWMPYIRLTQTVRLKAVAGGGGKGQGKADTIERLVELFPQKVKEAADSFGCGELIAEMNVSRFIHMEAQFVADRFGNVVVLGERECTLQENDQKLAEFSNSPLFARFPHLKEQLRELGTRIPLELGYVGAGTVEVMVDPETGEIFIMELNARIQVEHTVTEMVSGVDIVREQVRIARGLPLSVRQEDVKSDGEAVEIRLKVSGGGVSTFRKFAVMGRESLEDLWALEAQEGVRVETAVTSGDTFPDFDPMFAKIIIKARNREELCKRVVHVLKLVEADVVGEGQVIVPKPGGAAYRDGEKPQKRKVSDAPRSTDLTRQIALFEDKRVREGKYDNRFMGSWDWKPPTGEAAVMVAATGFAARLIYHAERERGEQALAAGSDNETLLDDVCARTAVLVEKDPFLNTPFVPPTNALEVEVGVGRASEGAVEAFQGLIAGNAGRFAGPMAAVIADARGDWEALLGFPLDSTRHELRPVVVEGQDRLHVTSLVALENGEPRASLFPVWRDGKVPFLFRLSTSQEEGSLKLGLDAVGLDGTISSLSLEEEVQRLGEKESGYDTVRLLRDDPNELKVGCYFFRGQRTLTVLHQDGQPLLFVPPEYAARESHLDDLFEDRLAMAASLPEKFKRILEPEMDQLFCEVALLPEGHSGREAFIRRLIAAPFSIEARLLRYLGDRFSAEARQLALSLLLHSHYSGWGDVSFEKILPGDAVGIAKKKEGEREIAFAAYRLREGESIQEGLVSAVQRIRDRLADHPHSDGTIDLIVPARSLPLRISGQNGFPYQSVGSRLQTMVADMMGRPPLTDIQDRIWNITIIVDDGSDKEPAKITLRNRARYEADWRQVGYRVEFGSTPFVHDYVLNGVHAFQGAKLGLDRLGAYRAIESIPPYDRESGHILLLHGEREKHYYLASVLADNEANFDSGGKMTGLLTAHRRLANELRKQLGNSDRWDQRNPAPAWNRSRFHLEGVRDVVSLEIFEKGIENFAFETVPDRQGLDMEKTVVETVVQFPCQGGGENHRITAIVTIEDIDEVAVVHTRYRTAACIGGEVKEVLVNRETLLRMLADRNHQLKDGERWWSADQSIRDKSPLDRRRDVASKAGGVFVYDRAHQILPAAVQRLWQDSEQKPPEDACRVEEVFVEEGKFRIAEREPGRNSVGMAAFKATLKLPNYPEGYTVVFVGNDPTHPDAATGSFSFEGAKLFWLAGEYAGQNNFNFGYWPETSGAKMGLPEEIVPRKAGKPLRVQYDLQKKAIYLLRQDLDAVVREMKAENHEEIFLGRWEEAAGEERFYVDAILKGGINQKSLRGSGLAAGALARIAEKVGTFAGLLAGRGKGKAQGFMVGIGYYLWWLARNFRGQRAGSYGVLAGEDAIRKMVGGVKLFRNNEDLGGAERLFEGGASTAVYDTELEGMVETLRAANDRSKAVPAPGPETPVGKLTAHMAELRMRLEDSVPSLIREVMAKDLQSDPVDRDIGPDIEAATQRYKKIDPNNETRGRLYDVTDEFEALLDKGSFVPIKGLSHHAIAGFGRIHGKLVAVIGAQMLPEIIKDEKTGRNAVVSVTAFDGHGRPIRGHIPASSPPMTLAAKGAAELATVVKFMKDYYPDVPLAADLGASGYDPKTVAESGVAGKELLSGLANHPAPVILWAAPRKKIFGGMKVTIAKELGYRAKATLRDGVAINFGDLDEMADCGHIKSYAAPDSFEAVLDPPGWKGIKFVKDAVAYHAKTRYEEKKQDIEGSGELRQACRELASVKQRGEGELRGRAQKIAALLSECLMTDQGELLEALMDVQNVSRVIKRFAPDLEERSVIGFELLRTDFQQTKQKAQAESRSKAERVAEILSTLIGTPRESGIQNAMELVEGSKIAMAWFTEIAEKIVLGVVEKMSTISRAAADGSFTEVVGPDRIRGVIARDVDQWYGRGALALAGQ